MTLTGPELKTVTDELLQLSRQQNEALKSATHLEMSKEEAAAHENRQERIAQLGNCCEVIGP